MNYHAVVQVPGEPVQRVHVVFGSAAVIGRARAGAGSGERCYTPDLPLPGAGALEVEARLRRGGGAQVAECRIYRFPRRDAVSVRHGNDAVPVRLLPPPGEEAAAPERCDWGWVLADRDRVCLPGGWSFTYRLLAGATVAVLQGRRETGEAATLVLAPAPARGAPAGCCHTAVTFGRAGDEDPMVLLPGSGPYASRCMAEDDTVEEVWPFLLGGDAASGLVLAAVGEGERHVVIDGRRLAASTLPWGRVVELRAGHPDLKEGFARVGTLLVDVHG